MEVDKYTSKQMDTFTCVLVYLCTFVQFFLLKR